MIGRMFAGVAEAVRGCWDWWLRGALYDVGHGKGCECQGCAGERLARETW